MSKQHEITSFDWLCYDYHLNMSTIWLHLSYLCYKVGYNAGYKKLFTLHRRHNEYVMKHCERIREQVINHLKAYEEWAQSIGTLYQHKRVSTLGIKN